MLGFSPLSSAPLSADVDISWATNSAAGRSRRKRRVQVEIDGEVHSVSSAEEARELLEEVRRRAEEAAELAIARAAKAQKRQPRKVLADARKSLQLPSISAGEYQSMVDALMGNITDLYQSALNTIEISTLLRKKEREDEDDDDILMLIA